MFVVWVAADVVVWISGLADDAATLRRETRQMPERSTEAALRHQERVYAWITTGVILSAVLVGLSILLESALGTPATDLILGVAIGWLAFCFTAAGLSGLRTAITDKWGYRVFPGDAGEKQVRLRLRREGWAPDSRRARRLRWWTLPNGADLLVAAIVAWPFVLAVPAA